MRYSKQDFRPHRTSWIYVVLVLALLLGTMILAGKWDYEAEQEAECQKLGMYYDEDTDSCKR